MACPGTYAELPCSMTGVAYLAQAVSPGSNVYQLQRGHAQQLPELGAGQYFYASVQDACSDCCDQVRVVSVDRETDQVTVESVARGCACLSSNSRLRYESCTVPAIREIAREAAPAVEWPLIYDCATHTIRLDCQGVTEMVANPCSGG